MDAQFRPAMIDGQAQFRSSWLANASLQAVFQPNFIDGRAQFRAGFGLYGLPTAFAAGRLVFKAVKKITTFFVKPGRAL